MNQGQNIDDIERPIASDPMLKLDHPKHVFCLCKYGWAQEQLAAYVYMGCTVDYLSRSIEALTMLDDIGPVLDSLKKLSLGTSISGNKARLTPIMNSVDNVWDTQMDTAFFTVRIDPNTRQRLALRANPHQAIFFRMHNEELLARIANLDHPFPFPDFDALLVVLYRAVQTACLGSTGGPVYFRMSVGGGQIGVLARLCIVVMRDGDGRATEVRRTFREIGPDEYDAVTRRHPELCPLYALGDRRSGRQLLADFPADNVSPLSALAATPGCRRFLASLPGAVQALAAQLMRAAASMSMTVAAEAAAASAVAAAGAAAAAGMGGGGVMWTRMDPMGAGPFGSGHVSSGGCEHPSESWPVSGRFHVEDTGAALAWRTDSDSDAKTAAVASAGKDQATMQVCGSGGDGCGGGGDGGGGVGRGYSDGDEGDDGVDDDGRYRRRRRGGRHGEVGQTVGGGGPENGGCGEGMSVALYDQWAAAAAVAGVVTAAAAAVLDRAAEEDLHWPDETSG
jgi:hypothetical protein